MGYFRGLAWVGLGVVAVGGVRADPPAKTPPAPPPPDASLIEYLGSDDTGDPKWWEFLKQAQSKDATPTDSEPPEDKNR